MNSNLDVSSVFEAKLVPHGWADRVVVPCVLVAIVGVVAGIWAAISLRLSPHPILMAGLFVLVLALDFALFRLLAGPALMITIDQGKLTLARAARRKILAEVGIGQVTTTAGYHTVRSGKIRMRQAGIGLEIPGCGVIVVGQSISRSVYRWRGADPITHERQHARLKQPTHGLPTFEWRALVSALRLGDRLVMEIRG